jgi:hypothetical protein
MMNKTIGLVRAACILCTACILSGPLALTTAAQTRTGTPDAVTPVGEKALTAGVCADVTDGDILTFEWNPAFDNTSAVSGLREFALRFANASDFGVARRTQTGLLLSAVNRREGDLHPFKTLPNGFFQVTFHVHLKQGEAGEYHLVESWATANVEPEYKGKLPAMTNSPTNSPFCLNAIPSASRSHV